MPKHRQTLLFSATFSKEIKSLADKLLKSCVVIEAKRTNTPAEKIKQAIYLVDRSRKRELLSFLIGSENWKQVLVFTRTKHGANRLVEQLKKDGLNAAAIHGNKSQGARTRALSEFKDGKVRVLVATDIAARGLDIDKLPHVINFDLPDEPENYVHRIGRTGRASCSGIAISLVSPEEHKLLQPIEKLLKCNIKQEMIPGYEVSAHASPRKAPTSHRPFKKAPRRRSNFATKQQSSRSR